MGALYGVAAICFAVSCVNYFINGNILKGVLWLGLTVACGFLGYLRLKPQNNGDPASAEDTSSSVGGVAVEDESGNSDEANNVGDDR